MRRVLKILFLFSCIVARAATITNTTIVPSGGDYTALVSWEAGQQKNLVSGDLIEVGTITGTWSTNDNNAVTIGGWTTGTNNYVVVTNSTQLDGKRFGSTSGAYGLDVTNLSALLISEEFVRVYGLQIKVNGDDTVGYSGIGITGIGTGSGSKIYIKNCIVWGDLTGSGNSVGVNQADADAVVYLFNCIVYGFVDVPSGGAVGITTASSGAMEADNCTVYGCRTTYGTATLTVNNSISQSSALGFASVSAGNYNRSDLAADAPGANSISDTDGVLFVSTTPGAEDFHLSAAEVTNPNATSVIDYSSDLSGGLFANDIDDQTRTGSWDLGADEYVAVSSTKPQVILVR